MCCVVVYGAFVVGEALAFWINKMQKMRGEGIEPPTAGSGIQRSTTELSPHVLALLTDHFKPNLLHTTPSHKINHRVTPLQHTHTHAFPDKSHRHSAQHSRSHRGVGYTSHGLVHSLPSFAIRNPPSSRSVTPTTGNHTLTLYQLLYIMPDFRITGGRYRWVHSTHHRQ